MYGRFDRYEMLQGKHKAPNRSCLQCAASPFGLALAGRVRTKCTKSQMCSLDSTLPNAGMPLKRMPFFTIQKSSRSEYCCTSADPRSAALGYIHLPASVGFRPVKPWHSEHSVPKSLPPSSILACVSDGAGGMPPRLALRTRKCLALVAITASVLPGSGSAPKLN